MNSKHIRISSLVLAGVAAIVALELMLRLNDARVAETRQIEQVLEELDEIQRNDRYCEITNGADEASEPMEPEQPIQVSDRDYNPDIPLGPDEQDALLAACNEFRISPDIVLGLIERETGFRNIVGDSGKSQGYMQIQERWWSGLMKEIGTTDLRDPEDNFRTGCAILRQLIDQCGGDVAKALTIYNAGKDTGSRAYANAVLHNAEAYR